MSDHPSRSTLAGWIRGLSTGATAEAVERHLVQTCCFECVMELRELMAEAHVDFRENVRRSIQGADEDESFPLALRHAERRGAVMSVERELGPTLLRELLLRAPSPRRELVRTARRYQLFGFAQYLGSESREAVFHDFSRAHELAELAVEVAESLDPRIYVSIFTAEQQALAHACLGNVQRVGSDLFGADHSFQHAFSFLAQSAQSAQVSAEIRSLLGSLRIDQARYLEARPILREARKLFRRFRDRRQEGKVLIQLADVEGYSGQPEKAIPLLHRALALIEAEDGGRLLLQAHHNLIDWMVEAGEALEALARYEKARKLYDDLCTTPSLRLRRRWLEGRIHAALGDAETAVTAFEEVRAAARLREQSYELAMVSLELALVHLAQGRTDRVQELAEEITPIFRSHDLHRHALAAMTLFRHAARSRSATAGFVHEILRYLQRARNNPYLRFEPSGR
jgi:tetratricopeptide (TPR) repeat protein